MSLQKPLWIVYWLSPVLVASCGFTPDNQNQATMQNAEIADMALTGGKIFTSDDQNRWAEAIAIRDGKFIYVGDGAGVAKFISKSTRTSDLGGRLVIPGIIDGHTHPGYIDVERYGGFLTGTTRKEFMTGTPRNEILTEVEQYAEDHPNDEWIRLCCWRVNSYVKGKEGPNKRDLDAIIPDRPVWITSVFWHSYWLNSKALEVLGVDKHAVDPLPGVATYKRDGNGQLTGWVTDGAAWQHLPKHFGIVDAESHEKSMTAFLQTLSENGVTTVYDGGNFGFEDQVYSFLSRLEKSGKLPVRYQGTYQIFTPERKGQAIPEMKRLRRAYGGERLQFNTIKLFMDGITPDRTSAMLKPWADDPDYVGNTMMTADELRDFLLELNEEKFDLHVHTIGDLAVRTVLDAVEAAQAATKGNFYPRVTIAHLEIIDPADLLRIKELGVTANFTPWWHGGFDDASMDRALGKERIERRYPVKSLFDLGAIVTFSSDDWFLDVLSPFLGMQVGHNRQFPKEWGPEGGGNISGFRPPESERPDLEMMVRGYTKNGAYAFRMEKQIGSIEAGKLADLVVLDENLFEVDSNEIMNIKPLVVVMEGEVIHGSLP